MRVTLTRDEHPTRRLDCAPEPPYDDQEEEYRHRDGDGDGQVCLVHGCGRVGGFEIGGGFCEGRGRVDLDWGGGGGVADDGCTEIEILSRVLEIGKRLWGLAFGASGNWKCS